MISIWRYFVVALVIMSCAHTASFGSNTCEHGESCIDKEKCPDYQNFLNLTNKKERRLESKRLKKKICNLKPDRLCCKPKPQIPVPETCTQNSQAYPKSYLPEKHQCGQSCGGSKSVINGEDALLGEYPWTVLLGSEKHLQAFDNRKKKWTTRTYKIYPCGGTLINTWFVLTAAHCTNEKIVEVVLGEWDVKSDPDCPTKDCDNPKVQRKEIDSITVHNGYNKENLLNDIALLKMKSEAKLNIFVQLVCLPLPKFNLPIKFKPTENREATVTGWGRTTNENYDRQSHGLFTTRPKKGKVSISTLSNCISWYQDYPIETSQICADPHIRNKTDACNGDSGGGLFIDSGDYPGQSQGNMHVLVGVVSYGKKEICGDLPSVYTNVEHFIPWILKNIN